VRRYIFAGFLGAVGRLEKPFKTGHELKSRIARTQTASVVDVNLLCALDCLGKRLGLWTAHVHTYIEYLTQIVTVDFLEHIGLGKPLFQIMNMVSNTIMTSGFNQSSRTMSKHEQILIHRLGFRTMSVAVDSGCPGPSIFPTCITSGGS
jgi:hypothetical protein